MIIRRFKAKDAQALAKISIVASKELKWWHRESVDDLLKIHRKNKNLIWIAEEDDKIIGYLYGDIVFRKRILDSNTCLELASVYVIEKYRNKGIATKLTNKFLKAWKNSRYKGIFSFATNKISLLLLKDTGFKQKVYYMERKL